MAAPYCTSGYNVDLPDIHHVLGTGIAKMVSTCLLSGLSTAANGALSWTGSYPKAVNKKPETSS
jgi:hypothetical protein